MGRLGEDARRRKDVIVQPKSRPAQEALWRLVYDNDFHPLNAHRAGGENWVQPWTTRDGKGWDTQPAGAGGKFFTFENAPVPASWNSTRKRIRSAIICETGSATMTTARGKSAKGKTPSVISNSTCTTSARPATGRCG